MKQKNEVMLCSDNVEGFKELAIIEIKEDIETAIFGTVKNNKYIEVVNYKENDVYDIDDFKDRFLDIDGFGYPVKNGYMNTNIRIKPENLLNVPKDATEIVWFNR